MVKGKKGNFYRKAKTILENPKNKKILKMKILKWVKLTNTLLIFGGNKKRAVRFADHKTTLYNFFRYDKFTKK